MQRNVLVTGVTGFVGSQLAKRLLELDCEVYGLFRRRADASKPRRLAEMGIAEDVKLLTADITDLTSLFFALDRSRPDVVFHLAAQSYVPRSFSNPLETSRINSLGTQNLLEAVRLKDLDCKIVFAGSSEEYGLQIASERHHKWALEKYGIVFPEPERIPEFPVTENNPLRPMSPYAVSKVEGDFLMRNYYQAYGLKTIVSRGFNHEGAGRGREFVTSTIVRQCVSLKFGETEKIVVGNINVFRDWSHVEDIVNGYILLSEKGRVGDVYVQGSMRTNSVLTYLLLVLEHLGYEIREIETLTGAKKVSEPTQLTTDGFFNTKFERTKVDALLLNGDVAFGLEDKGLNIKTAKGTVTVEFDPSRFRSVDVPILMSDTGKIQRLGFRVERNLRELMRDQTNYYLNSENRRAY